MRTKEKVEILKTYVCGDMKWEDLKFIAQKIIENQKKEKKK